MLVILPWETLEYHPVGVGSHRVTTFGACSPNELDVLPNKETKQTRATLRTHLHTPLQVLSCRPVAGLQGASWKKSLHRSQLGPSVLC